MTLKATLIWFIVSLTLLACTSSPIVDGVATATPISLMATATSASSATFTPVPSATSTPAPSATSLPFAVTCADLDAAWGAEDWEAALGVLASLEEGGVGCGDEDLAGKYYAVHINYGDFLAQTGERDAAIRQYQAALEVRVGGVEALRGLARLDAPPEPTPFACEPSELAPYVSASASSESFVSVAENRFVLGEERFFVRGVNYYPRHAPWERFLREGDLGEMAEELDLIAAAGFNTVRIFLWYEPLFTCAPEEARPNAEAFSKLDAFIALAGERGLYLIVTLHDLPDLFVRPLYTDWTRYDAQTAFIVNRYRDEPAIMAWDLRNEGDLDYGARQPDEGFFSREEVLTWLAHSAEVVRANDERHLLTAGWWGDPTETSEAVEALSFHHWASADELNARLDALKAVDNVPILLEEVGSPSWGGEEGEGIQAQSLANVIRAAEQNGLAGWLVWSAFDFGPINDEPLHPEHTFGLWRIDLSAKPALGAIQKEVEGR